MQGEIFDVKNLAGRELDLAPIEFDGQTRDAQPVGNREAAIGSQLHVTKLYKCHGRQNVAEMPVV